MRTTTLSRRPVTGSATVTDITVGRGGRKSEEPAVITEAIREGALVADYRLLVRGMSQAELAFRSGIKRPTLAQYEKGTRRMPDCRVEAIAAALGIQAWKIRIIQTLPLPIELKVA